MLMFDFICHRDAIFIDIMDSLKHTIIKWHTVAINLDGHPNYALNVHLIYIQFIILKVLL